MALSKQATAASGASGSYWRVIHITLNKPVLKTTVATALYVNPNLEPIVVRQDDFEYGPFLLAMNAVQVAYEQLKALPDFEGAEDC